MSAEKITNLSIFIPHTACPHKCAFCDQNIITGMDKPPPPDKIREIAENRLPFLESGGYKAEIAFFGGTFTALSQNLMTEYLAAASYCLEKHPETFTGIRCSTRPDCVDGRIISLLKKYNVTAVELGAQSMDNDVLRANSRGHTAEDTVHAAKLIKDASIELGLQMMTGLYMDTAEKSRSTADAFIAIKPATVRIYPTVIMPNTRLAELYAEGKYTPFTFGDTVELCAGLYGKFTEAGIRIIRMGLDTSKEIEEKMLGGCYHPALGEICASRYYFGKLKDFMDNDGGRRFAVYADKKYFSKICGHGGENRKKLTALGYSFILKEKHGAAPEIFAVG